MSTVLRSTVETFLSIPSNAVDEEDLAKFGLRVPMWIMYIGSFLSAFAVLFVTSYRSALNTSFLTPINGQNDVDRYCENIPVLAEGVYVLDAFGHWYGSDDFIGGKSQYEIHLHSFTSTLKEWSTVIIDDFRTHLQSFANSVKSQKDLGWTMMAYSAYNYHYATETGSVDIYLSGDARYIFDFGFRSVGIASYMSKQTPQFCLPQYISHNYDKATGTVTLNMNVFRNETTESVINADLDLTLHQPPQIMCSEFHGVDTSQLNKDLDEFSMTFDLRLVSTAIAVNEGVASIASLTTAQNFDTDLTSFVDEFYSGMEPIQELKK